jgi:transcriptional regulator with XRE-family HTH domain
MFAPLRRPLLHGYPLALNSTEFGYSTMPSLPNYLRTNRKQFPLTQEEVAFLLGIKGMDKENKVSRDENHARIPTLETALAYEAIYGKPTRELFAGLYEQIARNVSSRAKILSYRKTVTPDPKKQQALSELALRYSKSAV